MAQGMSVSFGRSIAFILKYLNNYCMNCHDIQHYKQMDQHKFLSHIHGLGELAFLMQCGVWSKWAFTLT